MSTNVNVHAPSAGLGDTIAKATKFFGIDTLWDAAQTMFSRARGNDHTHGDCSGCEDRRLLYNQLFPYPNSEKKIKFNANFPLYKTVKDEKVLAYMGVKDTVIIVNKQHPMYPVLLPPIYSKVIEEVK